MTLDYRVGTLIGQGGGAETRLAVGPSGAIVGVEKRLGPRLRGDASAEAQLRAEASILAALSGRGAPRLLASGTDDAGPWLVMERVRWPTLAARLAAPHAADDRATLIARIAGPAFHALAAVHEAMDARGHLSVVHGDVSPENLLVDDGAGAARLVDFGLARFRDTPESVAHQRGPVRGTPRYLAPEVARGEPATIRSDLFSLGLTLLHAASGEPPRSSGSLAALVLEAGEQPLLPYAKRASDALPSSLRETLLATVAFEPGARPASARDAWRQAGDTDSW